MSISILYTCAVVFVISGVTNLLAKAACHRLSDTWSDSTLRAYTPMFRLYIAFMIHTATLLHQVKCENVLAFLEFLKLNGVKTSQMQNYISAIKSYSVKCSLPIAHLQDQKLGMYIKAIQKTATFSVKLKNLVDICLLEAIVRACDKTYMGTVFKAAYLLGFFGFLRLSNLVPHSITTFSYLKHLAKGDIFFTHSEAIILIKWSKTMQSNNQARLLKLPILGNVICPAQALKACLQLVPGSSNAPLFQFRMFKKWVPLTDNKVRSHLRDILIMCGKASDFVSFHSFRRSGASYAFEHSVPLQDIQRHGTWTSDCVWKYVTDSADAGSQVAQTFQKLLS